MDEAADHHLDITADVCPITFVKTKLLLERMRPGETADVCLPSGEPAENVPRSVREDGHEVLDLREAEPRNGRETYILRIRKTPPA